jgi:hypothetical protein
MSGKAAQTALAQLTMDSRPRVGITVSAAFGEELDNHVGVPTVPGLVVASIEFLAWSLLT